VNKFLSGMIDVFFYGSIFMFLFVVGAAVGIEILKAMGIV